MPASCSSDTLRPRLNPFAFPSDTTFRFVLLIVFAVSGSISSYGDLWFALRAAEVQPEQACVSTLLQRTQALPAELVDKLTIPLSPSYFEKLNLNITQLAHCSQLLRPEVEWQIVGIFLTITLALGIYFLFPVWMIWRVKLQPIGSEDAPGLLDELKHLCQEAELSPPPIFVWNPIKVDLPLAFGRRGRYYVALSGGFIASYFYADRASFRAILLHEMAHFRNGDVDKTYLTIAIWFAFAVTALTPSAAVFFWPGIHWSFVAGIPFYIVLWTCVIVLSGLGVLRTREYYADVLASVWDQTSVNLVRVLDAFPQPKGGRWRRFFRFHPEPAERRQTIKDTIGLFRLSFWDAFGIGVAGWFTVSSIQGIAVKFIPQEPQMFLGFYLLTSIGIPICVMSLAIGAAGIAVWRSAFAALMTGDDAHRNVGRVGVALALGFVLNASLIGLMGYIDKSIQLDNLLIPLEESFSTGLILLVSCFLIFSWIPGTVAAWLEIALQSKSPRPALISSVVIAMILVVTCFSGGAYLTMLLLRFPIQALGPSFSVYGLPFVFGLPLLVCVVVAWAFPLAACLWGKRKNLASLSAWAFLDRTPDEFPDKPPLRPHQAMMTGIVMGLIFCLALEILILRKYFPSGVANWIQSAFLWTETRASQAGMSGYEIVLSAAILQALTAAIAACRTQQLSVVHGLFAASVAGAIMAIGNYLVVGIGANQSLAETILVFITFLVQGALLALPTAIAASQVGNWAHRRYTSFIKAARNKSDDLQSPSKSMPKTTSRQKTKISTWSGVLLEEEDEHRGRKILNWFISSKGITALLFTMVILGGAYNIREVMLAARQADVYLKAAEQGNADAQFNLARMYFSGQGMRHDDAQAAQWTRKAAEQGHAGAQSNLVGMYAQGRGVTQDDAQAVQWFRKAADQGHAGARQNLQDMCARGIRQACS